MSEAFGDAALFAFASDHWFLVAIGAALFLALVAGAILGREPR